jgi:predicted nucleic-acid-binding Zn-ribbon protein
MIREPGMEKCVKCGSTAIVHRAMVMDLNDGQAQNLNLRVDREPAALLFKKPARSTLDAEVCSACGYTEFYANEPGALLDAFVQANGGM